MPDFAAGLLDHEFSGKNTVPSVGVDVLPPFGKGRDWMRTWLFDAGSQMLGADARHLGFLVDVAGGLLLVLVAQDWGQIALAVLAAIDQGPYVIDIPAVAGGDFLAAPVAAAAVGVEDALS